MGVVNMDFKCLSCHHFIIFIMHVCCMHIDVYDWNYIFDQCWYTNQATTDGGLYIGSSSKQEEIECRINYHLLEKPGLVDCIVRRLEMDV